MFNVVLYSKRLCVRNCASGPVSQFLTSVTDKLMVPGLGRNVMKFSSGTEAPTTLVRNGADNV